MIKKEVRPPWIAYPEVPPGDIFWRFGGEAYMHTVFMNYWSSLQFEEKLDYLKRWNAPQEWNNFLTPDIDPEFKDFLDQLDVEH